MLETAVATLEKWVPEATPLTRPFWDALDHGYLSIQRCSECHQAIFYPRWACPFCGVPEPSWIVASGRGFLESYIICHLPAPGYEQETPYVIAVVRLAEGPRMMSNLVEVKPEPSELTIDMPLELVVVARGTRHLPFFRPAKQDG